MREELLCYGIEFKERLAVCSCCAWRIECRALTQRTGLPDSPTVTLHPLPLPRKKKRK